GCLRAPTGSAILAEPPAPDADSVAEDRLRERPVPGQQTPGSTLWPPVRSGPGDYGSSGRYPLPSVPLSPLRWHLGTFRRRACLSRNSRPRRAGARPTCGETPCRVGGSRRRRTEAVAHGARTAASPQAWRTDQRTDSTPLPSSHAPATTGTEQGECV